MIKGKKINENITRDIINVREKKWRVVLPESFKRFMIENNGVIPLLKQVLLWKNFFALFL